MRARRWAVRTFLVVFAVVGFTGREGLWPLTGWHLFSHLRTPTQLSWEVAAVEDGGERPIAFERLPAPYQGAVHILRSFDSLSAEEQREVCRVWRDAAAPRASVLRIYRIERDVSLRVGDRGAHGIRTLSHTCAL